MAYTVNYLTFQANDQDIFYNRYNYPADAKIGNILNLDNYQKIAYCNQDDITNDQQYRCGRVNIRNGAGVHNGII